jgi:hypothetical protein
MSFSRYAYGAVYLVVALLFSFTAVGLVVFAGIEMIRALNPFVEVAFRQRFSGLLESLGLLTIAVAALELSQTVLEEEVLRSAQMSAPTRVRRFVSRFFVVLIVSLSIEFLVVVFRLIHDAPEKLPQASALGVATALLFAAWGVFVRLNRAAEELEPEAMAKAKKEDAHVEQ